MSNEAEIVHDQDGNRTIRVAGMYRDESYSPAIEEMFLRCSGSTAELVSVSDEEAPKKFRVRADVMDRIAESWQRYRADEEKRKADEEAQMEADATQAIAEAYEIARECPAIKIKEHPGPQWEVSVPKMGYRFERVVQWPSDLLWQARTARTAYDNWIEDQKEYARREASGSF